MMPKQPFPSLWQRCKSCFLFPFLAPLLFAQWIWHLLPFTDKTQEAETKRRGRSNYSISKNSSNITDFRPPPRWLLRLLALPLALLNPPDARHLEHVIGCLDRKEKVLLVGNQVGRDAGKEEGREGREGMEHFELRFLFLPFSPHSLLFAVLTGSRPVSLHHLAIPPHRNLRPVPS